MGAENVFNVKGRREKEEEIMSELARGCPHLLDFKEKSGLHSYQVIYKYLVKPQLVNSEARKVKVSN